MAGTGEAVCGVVCAGALSGAGGVGAGAFSAAACTIAGIGETVCGVGCAGALTGAGGIGAGCAFSAAADATEAEARSA